MAKLNSPMCDFPGEWPICGIRNKNINKSEYCRIAF